jgi:hypothetical protein
MKRLTLTAIAAIALSIPALASPQLRCELQQNQANALIGELLATRTLSLEGFKLNRTKAGTVKAIREQKIIIALAKKIDKQSKYQKRIGCISNSSLAKIKYATKEYIKDAQGSIGVLRAYGKRF